MQQPIHGLRRYANCSYAIGLAFWFPFSGQLELAQEGKTAYVVVQGKSATEAEMFAARELTHYLFKVTGAQFPIVSETNLPFMARGIYVGWTDFAVRQDVDCPALGEEEWVIRSAGKNLVLAGGRPRGTLYAVYQFLEAKIGCHWLDRYGTEIVPAKPTLTFEKMNERGKPYFKMRDIYTSPRRFWPTDEQWEHYMLYIIRNKGVAKEESGVRLKTSAYPEGHAKIYGTDGSYSYGSPGTCHTFADYLNAGKWFESHPEYFSLVGGKRLPAKDGSGPGQLCMTHPDVRKIVLERLKEFIKKDREQAARNGVPPPLIYDISQNDAGAAECQCTNCQVIAKQEGSESGPLVDFINAIADGIKGEHPEVLIQTFAYNRTQPPPKTLKPRDNVIIRWCDVYSTIDMVRPLSHEYNRKHYQELVGWGALAKHVAVWDYWVVYSIRYFATPYTMIQCLKPDLKFFADTHVEIIFAESPERVGGFYVIEENAVRGENFTALRYWLAHKLMEDPYQPVDPLIQPFLNGYYGPAAGKMREYLIYLEGRIDKEAGRMQMHASSYGMPHIDPDFFVTSERLFDEAEKLCKPQSRELLHVQHERNKVDLCLLDRWSDLERRLPANAKLPFDREAVIKRFEANMNAQLDTFYSPQARDEFKPRMAQTMAMFRDPKLPEPFCKLPARQVADLNMLTTLAYPNTPVPDSDAACGYAIRYADPEPGAHDQPLAFWIVGGPTNTLAPAETPKDGKYHLYKIGRANVNKNTLVQIFKPKKMRIYADRVYDPNSKDNKWDFYISLKVTGPAYVTGSTETNAVWLERVLLIKPQAAVTLPSGATGNVTRVNPVP